MSVKNIHHKFSIAVESDTPQGRAIGILKIAEVFETAGIHLSSDLNVETSRDLARCGDYTAELVQNNQLRAVMVESTSKTKAIERDTAGLYPVAYPALRVLTPEEEIRGTSFLEQTLGTAKAALKSFDEQVAADTNIVTGRPGFEHSTPIFNPKAHSTLTDACRAASADLDGQMKAALPGNIPEYEHNPMAQSEYFKANKPGSPPIFLRPDERFVSANWPEPIPVGLARTTLVVATPSNVDNEPNYDYTIVGFSSKLGRDTSTGWHEMKKISLLSNVDGEEGPNNVRVEDLLAICADHLNSLQLAGKASYSHVDAHKSIIKALHHLHGLTVLQHVKPTDQSDK